MNKPPLTKKKKRKAQQLLQEITKAKQSLEEVGDMKGQTKDKQDQRSIAGPKSNESISYKLEESLKSLTDFSGRQVMTVFLQNLDSW